MCHENRSRKEENHLHGGKEAKKTKINCQDHQHGMEGYRNALWSGSNKNRDVCTGPLARPFARTAHLFACFGLLASLAPSAALTRSLARSLRSLPRSWERGFLYEMNASISYSFNPLCIFVFRARISPV